MSDDRLWRRILRQVEEVDKREVHVGVLGSQGGDAPHGDSGFTVMEVAAAHELGTSTIPERSFIRSTCAAREDDIVDLQIKLCKGILALKMDADKALNVLGSSVQAMIKHTISTGENMLWDPLADSTIAAKGSDRPLVDTGQLLNSIQYEVRDREPDE